MDTMVSERVSWVLAEKGTAPQGEERAGAESDAGGGENERPPRRRPSGGARALPYGPGWAVKRPIYSYSTRPVAYASAHLFLFYI